MGVGVEEALLELYGTCNGTFWKYNQGWKTARTDPCISTWVGVSCSQQAIQELYVGVVKGLMPSLTYGNFRDLGLNWLQCTEFPQSICSLKNLKLLYAQSLAIMLELVKFH